MAVDWGSVFSAGFQALGSYASSRANERIARTQARYNYYPPQQYQQLPPQAAPYPYGNDGLTIPMTPTAGGMYTNAAYVPMPTTPTQAGLGALVPAGAAAVGALRALVPILSRWVGPTLVVQAAQELIANGFGGSGKKPVYVRESDNRVTGIMAGDLKAIRRVKKMGPRLTKALRAAGYGRGRRAKPRRAAARRRPAVRLVPAPATTYINS